MNKAAAAVLLHHHQQQQQQNQQQNNAVDLQQPQIVPQHDPSPHQHQSGSHHSAEDSSAGFSPSIVGVPPITANSTTSIHTTVASANAGGLELPQQQQAAQPPTNLSGFLVAAAAVAAENHQQQSQQQQMVVEPIQQQIAAIAGIQGKS